MTETNRSTGGRPKDTFVGPHLIPITDQNGIVTGRKCKYCDHIFGVKTSVTRIKAHLGGVPGHGVALCKNVSSIVKEDAKNAVPVKEVAKNAMPSSSTISRQSRMVQAGASTLNIPPHLGHTHTQQPCPQQNSEFCHLDPQARLQEIERLLLYSPQDGESHLRHDITRNGLSQPTQYIVEDHEGLQPTPKTLNPTSIGAQQTHERQNSESLSLIPLEPQHMSTEPQLEVHEKLSYNPQPNESCSTQGTLASQHPRQHHLREGHNHLPDQEVLRGAVGMDLGHDATTPRNLLQGGSCPNSLLDSAHQEDESDDHGGSEPQNMQLDDSLQRFNGVQLDPSAMAIDVLGHESPIEMSNLFGDFDVIPSTIRNDTVLGHESPLEMSNFIRDFDGIPSTVPNDTVLGRESPIEMSTLFGDFDGIPSTIPNDTQLNRNEMALNTPQPNEDCSVDGVLVSPHHVQQHLREPYQDVPQDASRMDSAEDMSIRQNILQRGGASPISSLRSAHEGHVPIVGFDNPEGMELQHHMQENPQENQSIGHDLIPPIRSQLQHWHIVSQLESSSTPTCAFDQTNERKRKNLNGSPPTGRKLPPLASIFQGATFKKKVDEIVKSLEDESVSRIGVYGMGGSGKTTIMKDIHNQLLEGYLIPLTHVIWLPVYQDHTIPKLQQYLAGMLDLTLAPTGGQVIWAAMLHEKMQNMRYALILDDVWANINLHDVGIPEPSQENMCKLILTTRSRDVCNKMNCNPAISLGLLSEEEAKMLFEKTLGDIPKNLTIQRIMKKIVKECACLPLAIVVIATNMRGKSDVYEWRNALESLQDRKYDTIDEEKKVISNLEFSFRALSKHLQQCLLYCALYPNDILQRNGEELIKMLVMEETIGSKKSLKSAYDHVRTTLKRLENACLLTCNFFGWEMHDLIRDMCLDIMGDRFLVKCHPNSPPDLFEYKEVVEKISLIGSEFQEIPANMMPYCPMLSTLLLSENKNLTRISDSFFTNFSGLKVLNLSCTAIQVLPSSVTKLVSLNALVLQGCYKLRFLPCLRPLKALKQLDLYSSGIEVVPEGLEELVNLTYLDLNGTNIKQVSISILANLVKLQHLKLPEGIEIMMKHVKELRKLEVFKADFANWEEFSEYVNSDLEPSVYDIKAEWTCVEASRASMIYNIYRDEEEGRVFGTLYLRHNIIVENRLSSEVIGQIPSPEIVEKLTLEGLYEEETKEDGELKGIFGAIVLFPFSNLVSLYVTCLDFTKDLISASSSVVESSSSPKVLPCFQNLQMLRIEFCKSLESIIVSTANPTEEEEGNNPISFPNLRELFLYKLSNLRSICNGSLICPSIERIIVIHCPKLKRLPLQVSVPVLDNNNDSGQPSSLLPPLSSLKQINGELKWWESLEWDQPHAKALLQPYFRSKRWPWGDTAPPTFIEKSPS